MQRASPLIPKIELRKTFLVSRSAIPNARKEEAALFLLERLKTRGRILTFYSIGSEINLSPLNTYLASKKRLMSNRLENGILVPYHVENEDELLISHLGIPEPNPEKACKASLTEIDLILVPGLAFDQDGYRLGYGKGYYDKFLTTTGDIPTAGVGFREQLSPEPLPRDPWDIAVKELILM